MVVELITVFWGVVFPTLGWHDRYRDVVIRLWSGFLLPRRGDTLLSFCGR